MTSERSILAALECVKMDLAPYVGIDLAKSPHYKIMGHIDNACDILSALVHGEASDD